MTYKNYIGIDISKKDFVAFVHGSGNPISYDNDIAGFQQFYCKFKSVLSTGFVVLETTGGYEQELILYLLGKDIKIHRADTRKVKNFIRSYGIKGKTDAIDAKALALYGYERHAQLTLYKPNSDKNEELRLLNDRRIELTQILVKEKNRKQSPIANKASKSSNQRIIDFLKKEIELIEAQIYEIIHSEKEFQEKIELMKTVDGVGDKTATALIAMLPELGNLSNNQIASLAGVAPHPCESGKKIGYRSTKKGGRQNVRQVLFMAAMAASKTKGHLGIFYRRLRVNGKKPMVALVALMRKIIVILNARIRQNINLKIA